MNEKNLKLFALSASKTLGAKISQNLAIPLSKCILARFSDGEFQIKIEENMRGCDVFIVQSTSYPADENLMELFIMIDAVKRASARSINVIIPYFGYARQDRKAVSREPITSKLIANSLQKIGVNRLLTVDLHAPQVQGFFDIPVDPLQTLSIFASYFKQKDNDNIIVVAPNNSEVTRARKMAKILNVPMAFVDKVRSKTDKRKNISIVGEVNGKDIIIVDDLIDTSETVVKASKILKENGAKKIYACCTHPVFSSQAMKKIQNSDIVEVVVTDTIPLNKMEEQNKVKVITLAPLISEAIERVHKNLPVSVLFD